MQLKMYVQLSGCIFAQCFPELIKDRFEEIVEGFWRQANMSFCVRAVDRKHRNCEPFRINVFQQGVLNYTHGSSRC